MRLLFKRKDFRRFILNILGISHTILKGLHNVFVKNNFLQYFWFNKTIKQIQK